MGDEAIVEGAQAAQAVGVAVSTVQTSPAAVKIGGQGFDRAVGKGWEGHIGGVVHVVVRFAGCKGRMRRYPGTPQEKGLIGAVARVFAEKVNGPVGDPGIFVVFNRYATGLGLEEEQIADAFGKTGANAVFSQVAEVVVIDPVIDAFFHCEEISKAVVPTVKVHLSNALRPVPGAQKKRHDGGEFG